MARSQRHLRYFYGVDSQLRTAFEFGEPSRVAPIEQYAIAIMKGRDPETITAPVAVPYNLSAPSITLLEGGDPQPGKTLRFNLGNWGGTTPITRNGVVLTVPDGEVVLSDLTSTTDRQITPNDIGTVFRLDVVASNVHGNAGASSTPHGPVVGIAPTAQVSPSLDGTMGVGNVLSCNVGTAFGIPSPTAARQVQMADTENGTYVDIEGATAETFLQTVAQAGKFLRLRTTWSNGTAPNAVVFSPSRQVPVVDTPYAELVPPAPDFVAGVEIDVTIDWQDNTGTLYAALYNGSAQLGARQAFTEADHNTTLAFTPDVAGNQWNWRVYDASSGGVLVWQSASFVVLSATEAIAIGTNLAASYVPNAVVALSGTYAGTWSGTGTLQVYDSLDAPVGSATNITNVLNGAWGPTNLTLPADADTGYYIKAVHGDGVTEVDSAAFEITAAAPLELATFTLIGTGAGANAIALFGHAFAEGAVPTTAGVPDDDLVLRSGGSTLHRTQVNVLSLWPDGSVKTALITGEAPALSNGATLAATLVRGLAHGDPGSNLSFATLLSGRTAEIRLYSPPNSGSPVQTVDPLDSIGSPDWHNGPLAISKRREYQLPSSTTGVSSVRLIVDVTATKDGMLYLDVCFSNDRVMHASGGIATFGFEIVVDGEVLHAQKPASGAATELLQYSQWIRRVGRNSGGTLKVGRGQTHEELVYVGPDHDALVASGTMLGYDRVRQMRSIEVDAEVNTPLATGNASFLTDPYYNWGKLARSAGAAGGRPEIGYRTFAQYMWLTENHVNGCILSHRMFEAAATRAMYYYDWDLGRWLNPIDWPKMSLTAHTASPAGTDRSTAQGLPSGQRPTHNATDHITIDHSHHGSMNCLVALLSGRRMAYDGLAARSAWACMDQQLRANGVLGVNTPDWRTLTPDKATGRAWAARPWQQQTRGWAWDFRDVVHAAIFIPDAYPNATFYKDNAEAWVNSLKDVLATIQAQWPANVIGLPMIHADLNHLAGFMYSFIFYGGADALRAGVGGANLQEIFEAWATFRVNSIVDGGFPYRSAHAGGNIYVRDGGGAAQTWAEAWAMSQAGGMPTVPEDWSVGMQEGDWQKNVLSGLAIMQRDDLGLPLSLRAKAADALVLLRSERQGTGGDPHPRTSPDKFVYNTNAMSNRVVGDPRISWEWDTAPVVVPGQSFTVAGDASSGALIGVVRFTGSIPRNSRGGLTPTTKAWEITSQPAGDPFAISQGGVLSLAGNPPAPGDYTVTVRPRTYNGGLLADGDPSGTLVLGTATDVTVTVTGEAALITDTTPASPAQIQENVAIGTTIFTFTVTGNLPITAAITSGNTTLFEVTQPSGGTFVLRTKASLIGETGTYPHTIEVDNGIGSPDTVNVSTQVVVETDAPVITGGQTFSLPESTGTGGATTPATVAYTGDPAVGAEFTAGNTGSRLGVAVDAGDVEITMALATRRRDVAQLTPTLRLFNAGGEDSKTVTVNITQPWAYAATAPSLHYIGAWSVARRLVDTYTGPLFRVRRSSDNTEQDIGFDSGTGLLDETALTTFVGAGNGFVVTLYDQSTEGANLTNATTSTQPQIVSSGSILRAGSNSRPTMLFGSNRRLDYTYATLPVGTVTSFLIAVQMHSSVAGFQRAAAIAEHQLITDGGKPYLVMGNGGEQHTNAASANQAIILYSRHNATINAPDRNRVGWTGNSIEQSSGGNNSLTTTNAVMTLGTNNLGHNPWPGRISEVVLSRAITVGTEETDLYAAMGTFLGV